MSIYLHIPFCRHRCGYCDFNTYAGLDGLVEPYVGALCREIETAARTAPAHLPVHTVFFGGGTPSLLAAGQVERILQAIGAGFELLPGAEISLEANPGTLSLEYLQALRRMGANRLSLGVQSANPDELRLLERQHDYPAVIQAVTWARQAGFDNLNLDLIFGLPYQRLEAWQHTLELALGLHPEHFSCYALTLEHGTPLAHWAERGLLSQPDPDLAADMYEWASERLERAGYEQYEISNWAVRRAGELLVCRHNMQYWRGLPYLGFGAGAHGYIAGQRTANVLSPAAYIQRLAGPSSESATPVAALSTPHSQTPSGDGDSAASSESATPVAALSTPHSQTPSGDGDSAEVAPPSAASRLPDYVTTRPRAFPYTPATQTLTPVGRADEIGETMMMGLRLLQEGVSAAGFERRFGAALGETFAAQIERFTALGLLDWDGERLRLTRAGRLLGNQVFMEFLAESEERPQIHTDET